MFWATSIHTSRYLDFHEQFLVKIKIFEGSFSHPFFWWDLQRNTFGFKCIYDRGCSVLFSLSLDSICFWASSFLVVLKLALQREFDAPPGWGDAGTSWIISDTHVSTEIKPLRLFKHQTATNREEEETAAEQWDWCVCGTSSIVINRNLMDGNMHSLQQHLRKLSKCKNTHHSSSFFLQK